MPLSSRSKHFPENSREQLYFQGLNLASVRITPNDILSRRGDRYLIGFLPAKAFSLLETITSSDDFLS
jgi:hypothetical protein